jgi:hypothetical protein
MAETPYMICSLDHKHISFGEGILVLQKTELLFTYVDVSGQQLETL